MQKRVKAQGIINRLIQILSATLTVSATALAFPGETLPVSIGLPGYGPMGNAQDAKISANGRFVAFSSSAPDLVLADTNQQLDVFVSDLSTGAITRISLSEAGVQPSLRCSSPSISGDGQFVVYSSASHQLVPGDFNGFEDIFVYDRSANATRLVTLTPTGASANGHSRYPVISDNGRFVTFSSAANNLVAGDTNGVDDIFVKDLMTGEITRVSVSTTGEPGTGASLAPDISADGRWITFQSTAAKLVSGDTNALSDIFLRDQLLGTTTRLSVSESGAQGNGAATLPRISANGAAVAFESAATNLVPGDTIANLDVLVRKVQLGTLTRASIPFSAGTTGGGGLTPDISADGQSVAFYSYAADLVASDTNGGPDVFVRNLATQTTVIAGPTPSVAATTYNSAHPSISGDGQRVSFTSHAPGLVAGDLNSSSDVFVHDLGGATQRVGNSVIDVMGNEASYTSSITADGRFVVFGSRASNLVPVDTNGVGDLFVRDMVLGTTTLVSVSTSGVQANDDASGVSIAANGRYVVFWSYATNLVNGDTNGDADVFLRDLVTNTTTRLSVSPTGAQGNHHSTNVRISADGRFVVFSSYADNLVTDDVNVREDVFVRDTTLNVTTRVSLGANGQGNGSSWQADITDDGRFVAFSSNATNLVEGDTNGRSDVFLRDRVLGTTTRISNGLLGAQSNQGSGNASISANGRYIAFVSSATNLVPDDTNGLADVFVFDRQTGTTRRVNVNSSGVQASGETDAAEISRNGRFVMFRSRAFNLVLPTVNYLNSYLHDLATGATVVVNRATSGATSNGPSLYASVSADARFAVFDTPGTNLTDRRVLGSYSNVFRRELAMPLSLSLTFSDWRGMRTPLTASYLLRANNGSVVASGNLDVALDGKVLIPRPADGTYDLIVKSSTFLARRLPIVINADAGNLGSQILTNGDVDGNNIIDIADHGILARAFGATPAAANWSANADLNGDLFVDVADYTILARNFDLFGDE